MNRYNSGGRLEKFLTGKGFYIVLFLCASVIGVSAWMLMAGNQTMIKESNEKNQARVGEKKVETVILPPAKEELQPVIKDRELIIEAAPEIKDEGPAEPEKIQEPEPEAVPEAAESFSEATSAEAYIWPVEGQLERRHDGKNLKYDATMKDWRSHEGIDILSSLGCPVKAARAGTVLSVENDGLFGTTVKLDHGDGVVSVYANLQEPAAVSVGQSVEAGTVIGSVGDSAICESSQSSHLHFAIEVNGRSSDPLEYLPS